MPRQPRKRLLPSDPSSDPFLNREQWTFARNALRRASYRWPSRYKAIIAARVRRGVYVCAICKKEIANKEKQLDHVSPIVDPVRGAASLGELAGRLLCDQAGWQILCREDHQKKSEIENVVRRAQRAGKTKVHPSGGRAGDAVVPSKRRRAAARKDAGEE